MPRVKSWAPWARSALTWTMGAQAVAIDTETTGLGFYDEPFCATLTWRSAKSDRLQSAYFSLEGDDYHRAGRALAEILDRTPVWIFHNAKFDLQKLLLPRNGAITGVIAPSWLAEHQIEDNQVVWHLLQENERKALKLLAKRHLGEETNEDEVLKRVRRKLKLRKDDGFQHIPREYLIPYALKDTEFTYRLWEKGKALLETKNDPALLDLYRMEIDLVKVLLRMESHGLGLDLDYLEATTSDYGARVMEGWQKVVDLTGNPDLNPQSPIQLKQAFAERGIFLESTEEAVLKGLDDELARAILQYRSDKKIHTTYLKPLLSEQRDGIVHPWFNPVGARTGRMSSGSASN